jgi:hypothetical protein
MSRSVAQSIATLQLTDIDRIVEQRHRDMRPRWHDRPLVWRNLLISAQKDDITSMRDFSVYGIQLLTGDLWDGR